MGTGILPDHLADCRHAPRVFEHAHLQAARIGDRRRDAIQGHGECAFLAANEFDIRQARIAARIRDVGIAIVKQSNQEDRGRRVARAQHLVQSIVTMTSSRPSGSGPAEQS